MAFLCRIFTYMFHIILSYSNLLGKMRKLFIYNQSHYNESYDDYFILIIIFRFDYYYILFQSTNVFIFYSRISRIF